MPFNPYDWLPLDTHAFGRLQLDAFLFVLNVLGTLVFAISGALSGRKHGFDLLGVAAVSFATANGGGTIRCLLLGNYPLFWIEDTLWLYLSLGAAVLTYFLPRPGASRYAERLWLFLDAVGLVTFSVSGAWVSWELHAPPVIAVLMGMLTGCGGGVVRDVLCNTHPFIFHKEVYATAALLAAAVFIAGICFGAAPSVSALAAFGCGLALRLASLRYGWSLHLRRV